MTNMPDEIWIDKFEDDGRAVATCDPRSGGTKYTRADLNNGVRERVEVVTVDEAEKFLFQNSMLSMHGAYETIKRFMKQYPNGLIIKEEK